MKITRAAVAPIVIAWVAAAVAYGALPLTGRVISFAGMSSSAPPAAVKSASAWAKPGGPSQAQLSRWGFVGGVADQLSTPSNSNRYGLSLVIEFSSPSNADAYLKADIAIAGKWTRFSVSGIPGALGFEQNQHSSGGSNVGFVSGPYAYVVGVGWQSGAQNEISNRTLIAAARKLYSRVHAAG
jgi:hypothetical protein